MKTHAKVSVQTKDSWEQHNYGKLRVNVLLQFRHVLKSNKYRTKINDIGYKMYVTSDKNCDVYSLQKSQTSVPCF